MLAEFDFELLLDIYFLGGPEQEGQGGEVQE
jgi:hypothetical protein